MTITLWHTLWELMDDCLLSSLTCATLPADEWPATLMTGSTCTPKWQRSTLVQYDNGINGSYILGGGGGRGGENAAQSIGVLSIHPLYSTV